MALNYSSGVMEDRCEFSQTCQKEEIDNAVYNLFDELYLSLGEEEILHPSEELHRQRWQKMVINSYHVFCHACKKHFYSRSVPTDINSFFQNHLNTVYHREFRDSRFPHSAEMITWEHKWKTGRCNVCQMSGLVAFVRDVKPINVIDMLDPHECFCFTVMQERNQTFLRKLSLLKKYCQLSIFREKFIKVLDGGSACLLCCSIIPWSGDDVKIHLGSEPHVEKFFHIMKNWFNLAPKDLLNGFNLEMVLRWIYRCTFKSPYKFSSDYDTHRWKCCVLSAECETVEKIKSSGHYCPLKIDELLYYRPSDFCKLDFCLLCREKVDFNHFKVVPHPIENLSEKSFGSSKTYRMFLKNYKFRLKPFSGTLVRYQRLKDGTNALHLKRGPVNVKTKYIKSIFKENLERIKNQPLKLSKNTSECNVCGCYVLPESASQHHAEYKHLYYCKTLQELEKRAADLRFFETFLRFRKYILCLLCGVLCVPQYFISHLKSNQHTKLFEWYCTLKNELPISSALQVQFKWKLVCHLCDSIILEEITERNCEKNAKVYQRHWPCRGVAKQREEADRPFKESDDLDEACSACSGTQGTHDKDCPTNSLKLENAIKKIMDAYEEKIYKSALTALRDRETRIQEKSMCECGKPREECEFWNLYHDLSETEGDKEKIDENEMNGVEEEKELGETQNGKKEFKCPMALSVGNGVKDKKSKEVGFPPLDAKLLTLLKEPSKLVEFALDLAAMVTATSESVTEIKLEKSVCETILRAVTSLYPQSRCYPFGSRLSELMFKNSDVDIFLDCGNMYEGTQTMCEESLKRVAKALRREPGVRGLVFIRKARVPIISFFHSKTGLHCDVSFKNALSVHNTLLIKDLIRVNYKIKCIVVFLKHWVKSTGLHKPPYFSSYAITMMVIFYLQQLNPPLLPTVEELQKAFKGHRLTIAGWDCSFSNTTEEFSKRFEDLPLEVLLEGFFSYYANFDYVNSMVSPLDGKPLPRKAFSSHRELPMAYKRHILNCPLPLSNLVPEEIPICVIDPLDISHVLTKSFTLNSLQKFIYYCGISADALKNGRVNPP